VATAVYKDGASAVFHSRMWLVLLPNQMGDPLAFTRPYPPAGRLNGTRCSTTTAPLLLLPLSSMIEDTPVLERAAVPVR
jgi:hypothetical protein